MEDRTVDKAFDGLTPDLAGSNPGVVTAGRPNMLGMVHAMKASKPTSCVIRFLVEKSTSVDDVLRVGSNSFYLGRLAIVESGRKHTLLRCAVCVCRSATTNRPVVFLLVADSASATIFLSPMYVGNLTVLGL